jgi:hypothetical protein
LAHPLHHQGSFIFQCSFLLWLVTAIWSYLLLVHDAFYIVPAKSRRDLEVSMIKALTSWMMLLQLVVLIWGYVYIQSLMSFCSFDFFCAHI